MDSLLRDYILMIVELNPVVDKETFLTYLKYFAVEQDYLVPEQYYHQMLEYRTPGDVSETTREDAYWQYTRDSRLERLNFIFSFWKNPSTRRTSLYASSTLFSSSKLERCIFLPCFSNQSTLPVFGFDHMNGYINLFI